MQRKIKVLISCIVTLCLTIGLLSFLTDVMERKSSDNKYADFFGQEEEFDVLFMGTSHVINAVSPMELWDNYGIVSYNLGGHSNQMATTYWTMMNALDYTAPKVMVIDCFGMNSEYKCSDIFSYVHLSLDAFPLSITKIKAISDLLDDPKLDEAIENGTARISDEPRTKIGLLWDYSVYHSRWTELSEEDFNLEKNLEKGAETRIAVARGNLNKINLDEKINLGTVSEEYLRKMIEECQGRGIEVLLTYLPFPASAERQKEANYVYDIAAEYNINYINFLDVDLINYQTDLYDASSHLNPSGARKITDYLGNYLVEKYSVENQKSNTEYAFWNEDYAEYVEFKNNNFRMQNNLINYLMLLSNDKVDVILDVRDKGLYKNAWIMNLLKNIGVDITSINETTDFIIKLEDYDNAIVVDNFRDDGCFCQTDIGEIELRYEMIEEENGEEKSCYTLYINGEKYLQERVEGDSSLNILVRRDEKMVDDVHFVYAVDSNNNVQVFSANRD